MRAQKSSRQVGVRRAPFVDPLEIARQVVTYRRGTIIYRQGDPCTTIFYIRMGSVELSVSSTMGREAVVAMLTRGDFFGEGCLADQPVRSGTAKALTDVTVVSIGKAEMLDRLRLEREFSHRFISHMLERNIRIEQDLLDQLFNPIEKRLARALLRLARGQEGRPVTITQETLANIVGTTRSRVNVFMKKFQRLGFIDYKHGLKVHDTLFTHLLND